LLETHICCEEETMRDRLGVITVLLVMSVFVTACTSWVREGPTPVPQTLEAAETPVVIDNDIGSEDMMSILYLLMRPELDVKAITVAGTGVAYCEDGTRHALGLLALAGAEEVPVACGREKPLQGQSAFPTSWRYDAKEFPGLTLPDGGAVSDLSAVDLLVSTIASSAQKVVLLAAGPLTNVAEALQKSPELVNNLEMIYVMGGALDVPGNVIKNDVAEWNIWVDPRAANLVLESGAPVTLVPLDATNKVPITPFFYEALKQHRTTAEANVVYELLTGSPSIYQGGMYFWDSATAAILADESLASFETRRLSVAEEGREEQGHVIEDAGGVAVRVAASIDARRFEEDFLSTLNRGGEVSIAEQVPDIVITSDGTNCAYDGPETVPVGDLTATIENQSDGRVGLAAVTLDEGRTFDDLDAWPSVNKPPWAELIGFAEGPARGRSVAVINVTKGPIYLVCLTPKSKLAVLGPVEVLG
jgi:pyrimidine-specific ribonucleoside hydrolase